jgi:hypothetical protein
MMTAISGASLGASSMQQLKTGIPGDRTKPGEVKGSASGAASLSDVTKSGVPGDRTKPGEVKVGGAPQSRLSSDMMSELLSMLQGSSAA